MLRRELRRLKERVSREPKDVVLELGELLLDARLLKDATCLLVSYCERKPDDAEALHLLAAAYFQQGNRGLGMQASRRSLRLDPKRVSALHNMALACVQEGRWARAGSYLKRGLEIAPDDHSLRRLQMTIRLKWAVGLARWVVGRAGSRRAELTQ
jgi:Flp pilus assembly protein TadD